VRHLSSDKEETDCTESHVSDYKKKVDSTYRPGYGTVLFFESHKILEEWAQKMPNYSKVSSFQLRLALPSSLTSLAILHLVRELGRYPPIHRLDRSIQGGARSITTAFRRNESRSQQGIIRTIELAW
jgi:hypothetical protein